MNNVLPALILAIGIVGAGACIGDGIAKGGEALGYRLGLGIHGALESFGADYKNSAEDVARIKSH